MTPDQWTQLTEKAMTIDATAYHEAARNDLSLATSTGLKHFRKSPAHYYGLKTGTIETKDTNAYRIGRALHCMTLELDSEFWNRWVVGGPVNPKTEKEYGVDTQKYKDWIAEQAAVGMEYLTTDEAETVKAMCHSCRNHPEIGNILRNGISEMTYRTTANFGGFPADDRIVNIQVRPDWLCHLDGYGLIDLKKCDDLDYFEYDYKRYDYAYQAALYWRVIKLATDIDLPVHVIAVEEKKPHRCGIWRISDETLTCHHDKNTVTLHELANCIATKTWPTRYEDMRTMTI